MGGWLGWGVCAWVGEWVFYKYCVFWTFSQTFIDIVCVSRKSAISIDLFSKCIDFRDGGAGLDLFGPFRTSSDLLRTLFGPFQTFFGPIVIVTQSLCSLDRG